MIQTVQGTVVATREAEVQRTSATESTSVMMATGTTRVVSQSDRVIARRGDPVAQAFFIDQEDGIFVTSLDLFFSQKSSSLPMTLQIRTMVNGYPTQTVLPFSTVNKNADDISISTDASVATTFTFDSPVYVQPMVVLGLLNKMKMLNLKLDVLHLQKTQ